MTRVIFTIICILFHAQFLASQIPDETEGLFVKGVTVDLREPVFTDGVLCTDQGGVITGPDIRIQARKIVYTKKMIDNLPIFTLEAEEDLMLEFGDYVFVGDRLEYDFQNKTGVIYNGRTGIEPWYFGGDEIRLCSDGSYIIYSGFVTTSENYDNEWEIKADVAKLTCDNQLSAKNVQFRAANIPLFWLPSFQFNLNSIFDSPIRYNFRWGGREGPRLGILYEIFSWNRFKAFFRFDYRATRGPGAGIETYYLSPDHRMSLETINYFARDSSLIHPNEKVRFRFQGVYHNQILDDKVGIDLTWDKLSDKDMATDYNDKGLELDTAGRTELHVRRQENFWISNFWTSVRVNGFQTLKQELPTLDTTWKPFNIGSTGIISENQLKASYLNFVYAENLPDVHDYNAARIELSHNFYRPFSLGQATLTPEAGFLGIFYSDSPEDHPETLAMGLFGCQLNTHLYKYYGTSCKHVITPYLHYQYYTFPTVNPEHHFIFDIEDGWYRLNMLRFGFSQDFLGKNCDDGCVQRLLHLDLWANAFFDTPTIPKTIPKVYTRLVWSFLPTLRHSLDAAWDIEENQLDHFNLRNEWTLNEDAAISLEFRHRSAFDWRKVDKSNFILDSFRSIQELRHSQVSDRRNTLLVHFFYRFHPSWALEFQSRSGWDRMREPSYNEYELDILTTLRSAWHMKLSYQHKEEDDRVAVYVSIGLKRPNASKYDCLIPCIEY